MFAPECFPSPYLEARLAEQKAEREAQEHAQTQSAQTPPPTTKTRPSPPQPARSSLAKQVFSQRPPISRPGSSTVLGNIYQDLARATGAQTPGSSQEVSRAQTPKPQSEMTEEERRKFWYEMDMVSLPICCSVEVDELSYGVVLM